MDPPPTTAAPSTADVKPTNTIITALSLYLPFLIVRLILFECIQCWLVNRRTVNLSGWAYAARRNAETTPCSPVAQRNYRPFGWIWPALRTNDDEIFEYCGLDTLCFLRFLRLGEKFALAGIGLSIILFPIYATAEHPLAQDRSKIDPLERITMSNLDQGEPRLWASVFAMYLMSFLAFYLFIEEYKVYIRRRHQFLGQLGAQQYSIVINDLPRRYRTSQNLAEYWRQMYPDDVHSVHVALECASLEKKVKDRLVVVNALEDALHNHASTHVRPTHRPGTMWKRNQPVDSIQYYQSKLRFLNSAIADEIRKVLEYERQVADQNSPPRQVDAGASGDEAARQEKGLPAVPQPPAGAGTSTVTAHMRPSAFVSFTTLQAAQSAQQLLQTENPAEMEVLPAPYNTDIVWENYGIPHRLRESWQLISMLLTVLIILFWTIPSSFVASLASVEQLQVLIPGLKKLLEDEPWMTEILKQLSPLGLILMSVLAYHIFGFLARREGHASGNQVAASHFGKLIYFQTFQIFFVSVIAGTVFDSLDEIINKPKLIISLLGTMMPGKAITFMVYLMVQATLKLTLELLLFVPMLFGILYQVCAPQRTARQRESPWLGFVRAPRTGQGEFEQTSRLPHYFLATLLVFAFCAIAPLLSYFAFFFFLASDIVYRRQVLFVYDPGFGTTGVYWPQLHDFLVGGLILAQVTFLGLTSLKVAAGPITFSTILPFFTIAYYWYSRSRFPRIAKNLPLNKCSELDEVRSRQLGAHEWSELLDNVYIQPALGESEPLLPEGDSSFDMEGGQDQDPDDATTTVELTLSPSTDSESEKKELTS